MRTICLCHSLTEALVALAREEAPGFTNTLDALCLGEVGEQG